MKNIKLNEKTFEKTFICLPKRANTISWRSFFLTIRMCRSESPSSTAKTKASRLYSVKNSAIDACYIL